MKHWLAWIAGAVAFVLIFYGAALGFHTWRVMHSPFMQDLKRRSAAYGCIGAVHDPMRPRSRAETWLARQYELDGVDVPVRRISWSLEALATERAVELGTDRTEANRMYAALPYGRFDSFNAVAREYAGKDYCALDPRRRQAVLDLYAVGSHAHIEEAMRAEPGA